MEPSNDVIGGGGGRWSVVRQPWRQYWGINIEKEACAQKRQERRC